LDGAPRALGHEEFELQLSCGRVVDTTFTQTESPNELSLNFVRNFFACYVVSIAVLRCCLPTTQHRQQSNTALLSALPPPCCHVWFRLEMMYQRLPAREHRRGGEKDGCRGWVGCKVKGIFPAAKEEHHSAAGPALTTGGLTHKGRMNLASTGFGLVRV